MQRKWTPSDMQSHIRGVAYTACAPSRRPRASCHIFFPIVRFFPSIIQMDEMVKNRVEKKLHKYLQSNRIKNRIDNLSATYN